MRLAFFSSEIFPFAKTGGLADVIGSLPLALEKMGVQSCLFMPKYKSVDTNTYAVKKITDTLSFIDISPRTKVYLISHDRYFDREDLYGDALGDYKDNLERFQFFCLNALQAIKQLRLKVDIAHCHDWQTALIPVYLKHKFQNDPLLKDMYSILTIHNLAYQGVFAKEEFPKTLLAGDIFGKGGFEFYGKMNLLKAGITNCNLVTTVSQTYAEEIKTKELGCGLEGVLQQKGDKITGILNGLDYNIWDPKKDSLIDCPFSDGDLKLKAKNKAAFQERLQFKVDKNIPLFAMVGRLSYQKGVELLAQAIEKLHQETLQIFVVGLGEEKYRGLLSGLEKKYPEKIKVRFVFDESLAHQVYAASDFFLMPSKYEPCGLSQLISFKYGVLPIVFKTGGLNDTVSDVMKGGNGFVFDRYEPDAFVMKIKEALKFYKNEDEMNAVRKRIMKEDYSWNKAAQKYRELYTASLTAKR